MAAELDTRELERFVRRLASDLPARADDVARRQADNVAGRIRSTVPRRSGRLAASVAVEPDRGGYAVSYGSGVPYAAYIERRTGTCEAAVAGAPDQFERDAETMARSVVNR